jgi:GT2 family glycosyltransferase
VDCRNGTDGLARTLASIECAGWPHAILTEQVAKGSNVITSPTELAKLLHGSGAAWVCPLKPGDLLAAGAANAYASVASADAAVIFADDDLLATDGVRHDPHFKPDWNPELFRHHDYLSGSCLLAVEPDLVADLDDNAWPRSLVDRLLAGGHKPVHVPAILHHRGERPLPEVPTGSLTFAAARQPSISVIIPTRDHAELLRHCLLGLERTAYPHIETIIVDNGSTQHDACDLIRHYEQRGARVLRRPGPFNFSALNNEAARVATGDLLCFLNNDIEVIDANWLETMAVQAVRSEVGAVGARLLYPDGLIQHAGVVLGIGGAAGHAHRFQRAHDPGYFERARLPQFVSAVTAACLVVQRCKFEAVGGFDEAQFLVAFNDVDLCLRLNSRGWQSLYEPRATLIHHESKSRGQDVTPEKRARFAGELAALQERWATDRQVDPYHHPHLSRFSEKFVLDLQ